MALPIPLQPQRPRRPALDEGQWSQAGGQRHQPDLAKVQVELEADRGVGDQHRLAQVHEQRAGQRGDRQQQRDFGAGPGHGWHSGRTSRVQRDGRVVLRIQVGSLPCHTIETAARCGVSWFIAST